MLGIPRIGVQSLSDQMFVDCPVRHRRVHPRTRILETLRIAINYSGELVYCSHNSGMIVSNLHCRVSHKKKSCLM